MSMWMRYCCKKIHHHHHLTNVSATTATLMLTLLLYIISTKQSTSLDSSSSVLTLCFLRECRHVEACVEKRFLDTPPLVFSIWSTEVSTHSFVGDRAKRCE